MKFGKPQRGDDICRIYLNIGSEPQRGGYIVAPLGLVFEI